MKSIDQNKNQKYETTSLNLAATLVALGLPLIGTKRTNPNRITFYFDQKHPLNEFLEGFWGRTLSVEPNALFEAQKFLKSCIYERSYEADK